LALVACNELCTTFISRKHHSPIRTQIDNRTNRIQKIKKGEKQKTRREMCVFSIIFYLEKKKGAKSNFNSHPSTPPDDGDGAKSWKEIKKIIPGKTCEEFL
jgi:hypothetical protein